MNKWQAEVQDSLLDSEKQVIEQLENQYKRALNDINKKVKLFDSDIKQLDEALNTDGLDDRSREVLESRRRSKVYQKQYQEALQKQIAATIDKLQADEYSTIEQYLKNCYTNGYVGTMYDIANQGIPIIAPIDQSAVVRAVLTDSKISKGLYTSLGIDANLLKKQITAEVSRGIATGLSYRDMARNLNNVAGTGLSNARRIIRTEGHRIQNASAFDAQQAARAKGCEVVKQWDATQDGKTRTTHRLLDGQIRETDEYFEIAGKKARYPGDFGDPAEDCNCRCALLTRARWALDEEELLILKERAAYYGLTEEKKQTFTDFKEKYLKAVEKSAKGDTIKSKSGAMYGALNDLNDPDGSKRDNHAIMYYEELRNSSKASFVDAVSSNTGIDAETVSKTYAHIFENKHDLDKGFTYFEPDYYMSESFRRLRTNDNIQEHDKILLRHEALEYDIMEANPDMSYEEAHRMAEKTYNYKKALIDWLNSERK